MTSSLHESVRRLLPQPLAMPIILRVRQLTGGRCAPGLVRLCVQQLNDDGLLTVHVGDEIAIYTTWTPLRPQGNDWADEGAGAAESDLYARLQLVRPHSRALRFCAARLLRQPESHVLGGFAERLAGYEQGVSEYGGAGSQARVTAERAIVRGYFERLRRCVTE